LHVPFWPLPGREQKQQRRGKQTKVAPTSLASPPLIPPSGSPWSKSHTDASGLLRRSWTLFFASASALCRIVARGREDSSLATTRDGLTMAAEKASCRKTAPGAINRKCGKKRVRSGATPSLVGIALGCLALGNRRGGGGGGGGGAAVASASWVERGSAPCVLVWICT